MARPRKPAPSTAYQRRSQRARALGYKSYYDFRTHDNGRLPPEAARPSGEARQRLRGHRAGKDLQRDLREGDLLVVTDSRRRGDGTYLWVDVKVIDERGRERVYRLSGAQLRTGRLAALVASVSSAGAVLSPSPSLDVRRYLGAS